MSQTSIEISCPSQSCTKINDAHFHLTLGISPDKGEGDVFASADVFEDRGELGGRLRAPTVGGNDDVTDGAGAGVERTNYSNGKVLL